MLQWSVVTQYYNLYYDSNLSGITSGRVLNGELYAHRLQKFIYHTISLQSSELNPNFNP